MTTRMHPPGAPVGKFQLHAERVQGEEAADIAVVIVVGSAAKGTGMAVSTNATTLPGHMERQAQLPAILRAAAAQIEAGMPTSIGVSFDPLTGRRSS